MRRSSGKRCAGHFGERQPGKALWIAAERIGAAQHRLDAHQILQRDRRAEKLVRRMVGRQIDQRGDAERLAGVADQRLLDRGVVLRPPEPWHGPDRRVADRRIVGVQVLFKSRTGRLPRDRCRKPGCRSGSSASSRPYPSSVSFWPLALSVFLVDLDLLAAGNRRRPESSCLSLSRSALLASGPSTRVAKRSKRPGTFKV